MIDLGLCSSEEIFVDGDENQTAPVFGELLTRNLPADEPDYVLFDLNLSAKRTARQNACVTTLLINSTKKPV
jgi:hypothetical protein